MALTSSGRDMSTTLVCKGSSVIAGSIMNFFICRFVVFVVIKGFVGTSATGGSGEFEDFGMNNIEAMSEFMLKNWSNGVKKRD